MSAHDGMTDPVFPRGALLGAAALLLFTVSSAAVARLSGLGTVQMPEAVSVESRQLRFADRADGAIEVTDARTGGTAAVVDPGTNGFVRGALRGLARERKRQGVGIEPPFVLTRWADGRLSLTDPATGRVINLEAFGPTNAEAFARLLGTEGRAS
ncbi:phosphonoacetaldehyde methylase [Skermanella stibiiresistens SB22]|uniref:Phosphonoacetaldehyde methylase n=1 Tax=Skermanella stibiiresistens SB22 TaxID=1385369 RepID=W9H486_9PROT|nr:photosynthetic complex assembly protein PuhC [Skermanella stibiiresistens]EWY39532.1 phosphonoacetaldehyde methylase [Skermanella stibiiresistens SB22]